MTRAVYVDVAVSLTADDFLLLLRRFASIYGKPAHIFSDNETNLVGHLREQQMVMESDQQESMCCNPRTSERPFQNVLLLETKENVREHHTPLRI